MDADRWRMLKTLYGRIMDLTLTSRRAYAAEISQPSLARDLGQLIAPVQGRAALLEPTQLLERAQQRAARVRVLKNGQVLQDRYEVRAFIGEGGMGEVYRAFDRFSRQDVAIKTLRGDLASDPVLVARLRRELQLARRVTHTNICRLHDIGRFRKSEESEVVFLSMELLRGETLGDMISNQRMPIETASEIASQITQGLEAAHAAGIIHRDFKSANIFVTHDQAGQLRAVISDFGVAQEASPLLGENATSFGLNAVVGTPAYMAPEQLEGKPVTTAADIYSLGVVLFEMVSGHLPVEGSSPVNIALRRLREAAPDVRTLQPDVPRRWAMTISACLEREPSRRPGSAEAVRQMLLGQTEPPSGSISRRSLLIGGAGVATAVAASLPFVLKTDSRPIPAEAKRHFELGQVFAKRRTRESLVEAVAEFERAVQVAPDFGDAYVGLADAYSAMANFSFIDPKSGWSKARRAADAAVRLNPQSGPAIGVQGYLVSIDLRKWTRAEAFFVKAVRLSPHDSRVRLWFGSWLGKRARFKEALANVDAGLEQDPASLALHQQRAVELMHARRFKDMLAEAQEVVRLQPYEGQAHLILARAYEWSHRYEDALACCSRAESFGNSAVAMSTRGCIEAVAGNMLAAKKLAEQVYQVWLKTPFETLMLAQLLSRTHGVKEVVGVLDAGFEREDSTILGAPTSPYFEKWHGEELFQQFVRRLG